MMAALLLGLAGAGCATEGTGPMGATATPDQIVGVTWRLTTLQKPGEPATVPPEGRFSLELRGDGSLFARADCNVCNGSYVLGDGTLVVERGLLACTLAACPSAPFDTEYAGILAAVQTWEGDASRLSIAGDGGRLDFARDPS